MIASYDTKPTGEYLAFQRAYDFFNAELFGGRLPDCLITLQRKHGARGYFWAAQFSARTAGQATDEIAMNPETFAGRSDAEILSTLVHEMCHLQQHHFGKPSRNAYHNAEWGAMMRAVGLIPSATGKPGGKTTGQKMTHYIEEGGAFARSCARLLAGGFALRWQAAGRDIGGDAAAKKRASKTKYICEECGQNAWAKPGARLICGDCDLPMIAEEVGV